MRKSSSYILYAVILVLFIAGAATYYGSNPVLQGNVEKIFKNSDITFEVNEDSLGGNKVLGPDDSVLLARFKLKSDADIKLNNLQVSLKNNADTAQYVDYLYLKFPSNKYQPKDLSAYSKIKWSANAPRFNGLNLQVPADSEDVRIEIYAKLKSNAVPGTIQLVFDNFGYLDTESSVVKTAEVNYSSENTL
ncbi:hypothetical protein HY463_00720 [Candidatus Peregrinibacteria bacterium]|nr:hypothetical protein [Candidatus Peregrinibacteria bacterium]